jgi:hypothetical protein
MILCQEKVHFFSLIKTNIRDSLKMVNFMEEEHFFIQLAINILDNG